MLDRSGTRLTAWLLLLSLTPPVQATQWVTLGPRAMGMGGAYTAIAEGPVGAYYNPGALGQQVDNPAGVSMVGGGRYEINGSVFDGANDMHEVIKQCPGGTLCTAADVAAAARKMNNPSGEGGLAEAVGGLNFKFGRMAFFANTFSFRGVTPGPIDLAATAANTTTLRVRGGSFHEFGLGYGHEVLETGVFLGMNVKGIVARTGYTDFLVGRENPDPGNVMRNYDRSTVVGFMPAVDVGFLWDVRETFPDAWLHPRIGVVGRNVNAPRFSVPARAKALNDSHRFYSIQGQSRIGVAIDPLSWWTITSDLDLTENLTAVERYTSQLYGAGMEFRIFNEPGFSLPIRGGVSKNIVQGNSGTLWSVGMGLKLVNFHLDVAMQIPERYHRIQTIGGVERVPHQAGASAQLSVLFGGHESIAEPGRDPFSAAPARLPKTPSRPSGRDPFRR